MKIRRLCAAALALTMSMTMLAGCGKKVEDNPSGSTGSTGGTGPAASGEVAMGRYVEAEIPLPGDEDMGDERMMHLIQRDDGQVFLYAVKTLPETQQFDVLCWAWTGSGWEAKDSGLNQVPTGMAGEDPLYVISVQQYADGTEYMMYLNWNTYNEEDMTIESSIIKSTPEGGAAPYIDAPLVTLHNPDYAHVFSDGTILTSSFLGAIRYYPDGRKKDELLQGSSPNSSRTLVVAGDMDYVTLTPEETALVRYNIETGVAGENIPLVKPDTSYSFDGALALDPDGNLYMANAGGIHYWKKGGSIWETMADGNLNSLSMPSLSIMSLVLGYDKDYLIMAVDSTGGVRVLRFYYEPDVSSVPSDTISIFGLSDSPTVRQAISQYQKQNPDVRVDYQVSDGGDGSATITDTIKALNTELLNKKGADILILDGLPVADYIEKGVLADISGLIRPMAADGTLLEQATGVSGGDGSSLYSVAVRYQYPIMFGTDEGLAAMQSLETIRDYDGNLPLLKNKNYSEIMKFLMNIYHAELFGDDGMVSRDNLILLLETAKAIHDKGMDPNLDTLPYTKESYNFESEYGLSSQDSADVYIGKAAVTAEPLMNVSSIMRPTEFMRPFGGKPVTANGIYFPTLIVGINDSSNHKSQAEDFIKMLLSEEIQSAQLYDGFPVNRAAFEGWRIYRNDDSMIGGYMPTDDGAGIEFTAVWPSVEQQNEYFDLQKEMKTPVVPDRVLTEMIIDEAKTYFDGKADVAGAADAIGNRAAIYLSE